MACNRIERMIRHLKRFQRIAIRYDRRAADLLAAIHRVATLERIPNVDPA
jgi:transposase